MIEKGATVLVTGATGFTGAALVHRLCNAGCRVRVIARPTSDRSKLDGLGIEWFEGDVFDCDVVEQAIKSVDYVFHVAATYRTAGIPDTVHRQVHLDSTQLLGRAAIRLAPKIKRFVHFSTVGVHGHIEKPPANESAPFNPGDIYQVTKLEGEQWIVDFADRSGLPLTVVRPAAILGPEDDRLLKLFRFARLPIVPLIGYSHGLYHLIHIDDLIEFVLVAATSEQTLSQVYICGNEQPTSIKEIVSIVAAEIGCNPWFVRLPAGPVFLMARICEVVFRWAGREPPLYPRRVAFFTKDRAFDTSKMRRVGGFSLQYDNCSAILDTCRGYRKSGLL